MSTDRELLELAAKAAGYGVNLLADDPRDWYRYDTPNKMVWNPLIDDGDALRLALHLRMAVDMSADEGYTEVRYFVGKEMFARAITHIDHREAICRAAAEIGKQ